MGNNVATTPANGQRANTPTTTQTSTPTPTPETPTPPPPAKPKISRREAVERIRELLECAICLEELRNPRVLPCHHSFCFQCLEQHCKGSRTFKCPNCNRVVNLSRGVSELPLDFRANSLQECLPEDDSDECAGDVSPPLSVSAVPQPSQLPACSTRTNVMGMLICPICNNLLVEPRLLDCGHSFCTACLDFMTPVGDLIIFCPCCDGQTPVPNGVEGLQIDADKCYMVKMFTKPGAATGTTPLANELRFSESGSSRILQSTAVPIQGHDVAPPLLSPSDTTARCDARSPRRVYGFGSKLKESIVIALAIVGLRLGFFNLSLFYTLVLDALLVASILIPILYLQSLNTGPYVRNFIRYQYPDRIIGAIVGTAFMTTYGAKSDEAVFYAVSGGVLGCVLLCWRATFSGQCAQISTRSFIEGLGPRTVWLIVSGGLYGAGANIFRFAFKALYGTILGGAISSYIIAQFKQGGIASNLTMFSVFITCRGILFGSITASVLSKVLHEGFGKLTSALWGTVIGIGIGMICGDIYIPMLNSLLMSKGRTDVSDANSGSQIPRARVSLQKRVLLAVGTVSGAVIGYLASGQIFAVLIGALMGLYVCEQWLRYLSVAIEGMQRLYVHCAVGGLVGCVVGVAIGTGHYKPIYGPMIGLYIESFLFQMYKEHTEIGDGYRVTN